MKLKIPYLQKPFNRLLVLLLGCLIAGCSSVDNFDKDDFKFFRDQNKIEPVTLRRYSEPNLNQPPLIQFLVDHNYSLSINYNKHLKKICDYAKLPYQAVDLKIWNTSPDIVPSTRVICLVETKKISPKSIDKLIEFVANGGTLFLPFSSEDKRIGFLIGFKSNAEFETDITSKGFFFKTPILPNLKDITFNDEALHYGFAKQNFKNEIKIIATAINDKNYPLIVKNSIGKGKVILYNTTMEFNKIDRGLLFSGVLNGLEGVPYPIANTATIFLDDFPAPLYDIKSEPIKSEMNLTSTDFVKKVWWPDMIKLAQKHKLKYAAMIAFDYKNKVYPPFLFDQWDTHKVKTNDKVEILSDWLVNDVKKNGHELAFHGYNHVSIKKELWKNPYYVGTSLKAVQKKWDVNNFGTMPIVYVPPSNIIDFQGINLLKKGMPSLQYMCSVYLGFTGEGGNREFDFDPFNKNLFGYPRITDGFYLSNIKKYSREAMYLYTGIWTHFVHPDDVYQIASPFNKSGGDYDLRNEKGLGWYKTKGKKIGMFTEFDNYLKQTAVTYPQIRYVNASEGGKIVNDWRASSFSHQSANGTYTVEEINPELSLSNNQYWFVYGSHENASKMDAQLKKEKVLFSKTPFLEGFLYSVYTNQSKLTLPDFNYKTPATKNEIAKRTQSILEEFKRYLSEIKQFILLDAMEWVDDSDENFKIELDFLKNKMLTETKIDSATWNTYAKYMTWEDKGIEVWKMLEAHCTKNPLPQNMMYSKQLDRIIGYPDDIVHEKWLSEQMQITPGDIALLNNYIANFYTPENQKKIKMAFLNLIQVDPNIEIYKQYIQFLMIYEPEAARAELDKLEPSEKYESIATDIVWLYADNEDYKKASKWAEYADNISFSSKMYWKIEKKAFGPLENEYEKYIAQNPTDNAAKAIMVTVYHEQGRFKKAWLATLSLPESPEKEHLKKMLNADVVYLETELQQDLLDNYSELFYPEVKNKLIKAHRREFGNFIDFNSALESNKKDPSAFKNVLSYNLYDGQKNLHSIGATFSKMYKIEFQIDDLDNNITHTLFGIQYQFNNLKQENKLHYWSKIRAEYSDSEKIYYQFGLGANLSKNKKYRSAEFKIFPAESGPAHSKNIYRMQLNYYQDSYFLKYLNGSLSFEGNYYTQSKTNSVFTTGDSYEGSLTGKLSLDTGEDKKSKFMPFIEASYSQASIAKGIIDDNYGYPYWIIKNRFFTGGGLGWKFGKSDSDLTGRVEAGWFYDDYSDEFKRYMGEISYQIFNYTGLKVSFELYTQSKFYSNAIQFGVKHNLKYKKNSNRQKD